MQSQALLSLVILSGIVGFAVYCLACAGQVWRARNNNGRSNGSSAATPAVRFGRIAACALLAGLCCIAAAIAFRAAVSRAGRLTAANVFTLRAQDDMTVAEVPAEGTAVERGAPLARFGSPTMQSELAALELKKEILEAERRIISKQPLAPDPETARRQQELSNERRHLQSSHDYLVPELGLVTRERSRDRAAKQEEIVRLGGEIERVRTEIAQAEIREQLHEGQRKRTESLARNSVASVDETAQREADAKYSEAEVKKLKRKLEDLVAEKQEMERGLEQTQGIAASQSDSLNQQIADLRQRLASLSSEEAATAEALREQLAAAEARREAKLAQIDLELKQCEHELQGLAATLTVPAPFAGTVAYRNPAPNAAFGDEPLVVLAPQDAFILRLRLPTAEAPSLQGAGRVTVELTNGIERRFTAKPLRWRRLADEPSYAVAELTCTPPAEAIRGLAEGKAVDAKLRWTPPLYTHPLFLVGCGCLVFGAAVAVVVRRRSYAEPPVTETALAAPAMALAADPGAESAHDAVELLATQLRDGILAGDLDPHLLSAIEWSLDRHHVRSIQSLAGGLGDDPLLADRAEMLLLKLAEESDDSYHARLLLRLTRLLGVLGGPLLQERLYDLRHRSDAMHALGHANGNGNGHGHGHGHARSHGRGNDNGNGHGIRKHGNGSEKQSPVHA